MLPTAHNWRICCGHPWMIEATSHLQPLGPAILAVLEFALGALEPTGLGAGARLETFGLVNGFVTGMVRAELIGRAAAVPDPAQAARLAELLATGQYPRFAAAVAQGGLPPADLTVQFERLLDRILDGLVQPVSDTPGLALLGDGEGFGDAIRLRR
jgi:hypothetical protein